MRPVNLALHLVTDRNLARGRNLVDVVQAAVQGGVTVVQLREKECATRDFVELGRAIMATLKNTDIPLLINDRIDIALAVGADGVAVVSAICSAVDPLQATRRLSKLHM
jgi:thiamine-phosphate pyrophosphorylase